jgi:hypothetical protein
VSISQLLDLGKTAQEGFSWSAKRNKKVTAKLTNVAVIPAERTVSSVIVALYDCYLRLRLFNCDSQFVERFFVALCGGLFVT